LSPPSISLIDAPRRADRCLPACVYRGSSSQAVTVISPFKHISFDLSASILSVVYPSRRLVSPTTRAFLEFLNEICRQ
jgi:DNA-binding transcriptional LysR family regulator